MLQTGQTFQTLQMWQREKIRRKILIKSRRKNRRRRKNYLGLCGRIWRGEKKCHAELNVILSTAPKIMLRQAQHDIEICLKKSQPKILQPPKTDDFEPTPPSQSQTASNTNSRKPRPSPTALCGFLPRSLSR